MTDDESVAFVTALMDGLTFGPVPEEDGYVRTDGWRRGQQSVDREIRALLAAKVLVETRPVDVIGAPRGKPTLRRGPRDIDERDYDGSR